LHLSSPDIAYLSQVDLNFNATPSFSGLGPALGAVLANPPKLNLGTTVPQSVLVGAYHELNDKWALMADVGWQNWHQFGYVQAGIESGGATTTLNLKFQDTWIGDLSVDHRSNLGLRGRVSGAFNDAWSSVTALSLIWKF
jgi:long-chain fatty acid transport protein